MKRVLIVSTLGLHYEGITSVIYNYSSHINLNNVQMDYIAYDDISDELKSQFESMGQVLIVPERKEHLTGYIKSLNAILKNRYDVVHIHGNSGTMVIETLLSKLHRIKKVLVHAHSTKCNHPRLNILLVLLMKPMADLRIACSELSGRWLYGKSAFKVLNNAIDLQRFRYDDKERTLCRKELEVEDCFVIGHIGHFTTPKNHEFLIDVFAEYYKRDSNARLLLISDGPFFEDMKKKAEQLGLSSRVFFLGRRTDVDRLYMAMDLFLMPSRWEGLPVAMLEAQAAALPVLVSDAVTTDAKCTARTFYKALADGPASWADEIDAIRTNQFERNDSVINEIRKHHFDIEAEALVLENIYLAE